MDKEYNVAPLFAVPVFNSEVEPVSQSVIDYIASVDYERMNSKNGWYTEDKYLLNKPECKELKDKIMNELNFFIRNVLHVREGIDFEMTNSWGVKHDKGDWGQAHVHTNCLLSGVYYLSVDDRAGQIRFRKETGYTNLFPIAVDIEFDEWNIFNSKVWSYQPKNNQVFFFPSNILHSIDDNESDQTRYSVAFNFFPKGKLGTKEFELELK